MRFSVGEDASVGAEEIGGVVDGFRLEFGIADEGMDAEVSAGNLNGLKFVWRDGDGPGLKTLVKVSLGYVPTEVD